MSALRQAETGFRLIRNLRLTDRRSSQARSLQADPKGIDRDPARAQIELKGNRELGDVFNN